jgi:NADH dehydrogenase
MAQRKIVILGAGFAGLQLARRLKKSDHDITLIDQYNFHQFQPLFYQVATARLEPSSISFPLRKVFQRRKNVHVRVSKIDSIDTTARVVHTSIAGDFPYDELIVATGCTSNYFGNKSVEEHAFPMKSTPEAQALRNRILLNFEEALKAGPEELEAIMNIIVIGGGPTGVELAGSLSEMKRNVLPKDYPDMDFARLKIYLIEGSEHTLNAMSPASQQKSQQYLEEMGVEIWLKALLKDYDGTTVSLADGRTLKSKTVIWAAGVMGNVPPGIPKESIVRGNRIQVDEFHKVKGLENVYALGDVWKRPIGRRATRSSQTSPSIRPRTCRRTSARRPKRSRSGIKTRAQWRRSGNEKRWWTCLSSRSKACLPGLPGCSCTLCSS